MKFEISRTSCWSSEELPCKGVTKEYNVVKMPKRDFGYNYYSKDINSLDELMDFIKNVANNKVVIQWNEWSKLYEIEIYDTWRE